MGTSQRELPPSHPHPLARTTTASRSCGAKRGEKASRAVRARTPLPPPPALRFPRSPWSSARRIRAMCEPSAPAQPPTQLLSLPRVLRNARSPRGGARTDSARCTPACSIPGLWGGREGGMVEGLLPQMLGPSGFGCGKAQRMEGGWLRCSQLRSQPCRGGHRAVGSPKPFLIRTSSGTVTDGTRSLSPFLPRVPPGSPPVSAIGSHYRPRTAQPR